MKIFFIHIINKKARAGHPGFTLIETLFAILIFSAALMSLMAIASKGINATSTVRDEVTAHYLAQEGLETARNVRDTNYVNKTDWDAGFGLATGTPICLKASPCKVLYGSGTVAPILESCSGPTCPAVFFDEASGSFVNAGTGIPSKYFRTVYVTPAIATPGGNGLPDEYQVTAVVTWSSKTVPRSVVLQTLVKKWR